MLLCTFSTEREEENFVTLLDIASMLGLGFDFAAPIDSPKLHPSICVSYGAPPDENLRWGTSGVQKKHMCIGLTFVTEFCLFFFCLLVQPDGLLFCLKWDKPLCFPSSTLSTAGFPVLGDLSVHIRTCFLLFLAPMLPCFLVPLYLPLSLFPFILLSFFQSPVSLPDSLPDGAFHYSITSLTGDIKPLCSSCRPPCDKFADHYLLSVTASIHHQGAGILYSVMGKLHRAFHKCLLLLADWTLSSRDLC